MKKLYLFLILVLVLFTSVSFASAECCQNQNQNTNINLNVINEQKINRADLDPRVLQAVDQNRLVHALIDDYDAVAIKIDNQRFVFEIENNQIQSVEMSQTKFADYTIETTMNELVYMYQHRNEMTVGQKLGVLLNKDIPFRARFRIVKLMFWDTEEI